MALPLTIWSYERSYKMTPSAPRVRASSAGAAGLQTVAALAAQRPGPWRRGPLLPGDARLSELRFQLPVVATQGAMAVDLSREDLNGLDRLEDNVLGQVEVEEGPID